MKKFILSLVPFLWAVMISYAQVAITTDNSAPDNSAMLEVKSSSKGFLAPRMTYAERNAISSPAEGLVVICTNCKADGTGCISMFLAGQWLNLAGTCDLPVSPPEGSHVQSNTQIIWNWSAVPIADGYKWNTTNNFATATNMGTVTTKTETGLTTGTSYTRYVWGYNNCGPSAPTIMTGQALPCGSSFTVAHTARSVAPVTKTVTYGTVTNIPGETAKCWITRNLGASQQATSAADATEASAGWYWQFNRMQGFKHDGTTRTPNTTWITLISEDLDWESINDPCSILLGSAWRIPTSTEWTNADAAGNWTNWNGPYTSGLKMHAAGYLDNSVGFLWCKRNILE
ncbi:MAG: hypothetical protein NTW16_08235 [Bacteroidetes bacterium]|nr:hypothetical protein [Bacteroidota bacterium]